jgi:hypothetical protein
MFPREPVDPTPGPRDGETARLPLARPTGWVEQFSYEGDREG